jgi:hypothetical protein
MELDHVLFDFFSRAGFGAVAVFIVIVFAAFGIPRRIPATIRRSSNKP